MPHDASRSPLAAVRDALARGDAVAALAEAQAVVLRPPRWGSVDEEERAAALHAAGRVVALAQSRVGVGHGDGASASPRSAAAAFEMASLASAAAEGRLRGRLLAGLLGESLAILRAIAGRGASPPAATDPLEGVSLASTAEMLAALYREAGPIEAEAEAHDLRCRFALAFLGDAPHEVIAALNEAADCLRRSGRPGEARRRHDAVLADYAGLVDDLEATGLPPGDEDRLALESLADTYRARVELDPAEAGASAEATGRIEAILARDEQG